MLEGHNSTPREQLRAAGQRASRRTSLVCVAEFMSFGRIDLLLWRTQLRYARALVHYFQEVLARQIVAGLPDDAHQAVALAPKLFQSVISAWG